MQRCSNRNTKFDIKQQWRLILAICIAMITFLQAGISTGWTSPVLFILQSPNSTIPVSNDEGSWIATVFPLVALCFTPLGSLSLHYLGRKRTLVISLIPILIFWIMVSLATTTTELIIARGIAGIGVGFIFIVTPVYLGEISPDNVRGGIGIGMNVVFNAGTLWIYWIGTYPDLWFSSVASALPIFFILVFYKWLPESPYYLIATNQKEEAKDAIKKLKNSHKLEEEIERIESTIEKTSKIIAIKEVFTEPCHRRALLICIGTFTFSQLTGVVIFVYYAHLIFQKAGDIPANTMSLIKAFLQLITSIGAAYVVDSVGRKPLLIISSAGSSIFMAFEGIYFYLHDNGYNVDSIWWLPLAAMILFNISQAIGLQSISLAYLGELFHPQVKAVAVCICTSYLSLCVFTVAKLFLVMSDNLGNSVPFFVFAIVGVAGVFFVIFCVPETKGRSLKEIQYYMKHKTYDRITAI